MCVPPAASHLSKQVHTDVTRNRTATNAIAYSPQDLHYYKAYTETEEQNEMLLSLHYLKENKSRYFSCHVRLFATARPFGHCERLRNDQCDA
jgi:hypothetical protein